jgi:predicted DNA-binding transcriptional regulator YafY
LTKEYIELYRLNSSYITAYCNKRDEQRTFRFDRIGEIEILDI